MTGINGVRDGMGKDGGKSSFALEDKGQAKRSANGGIRCPMSGIGGHGVGVDAGRYGEIRRKAALDR